MFDIGDQFVTVEAVAGEGEVVCIARVGQSAAERQGGHSLVHLGGYEVAQRRAGGCALWQSVAVGAEVDEHFGDVRIEAHVSKYATDGGSADGAEEVMEIGLQCTAPAEVRAGIVGNGQARAEAGGGCVDGQWGEQSVKDGALDRLQAGIGRLNVAVSAAPLGHPKGGVARPSDVAQDVAQFLFRGA